MQQSHGKQNLAAKLTIKIPLLVLSLALRVITKSSETTAQPVEQGTIKPLIRPFLCPVEAQIQEAR